MLSGSPPAPRCLEAFGILVENLRAAVFVGNLHHPFEKIEGNALRTAAASARYFGNIFGHASFLSIGSANPIEARAGRESIPVRFVSDTSGPVA